MKPFYHKIILLALVYFALFLHLDGSPLFLWDEARLAESAFEMLHTQNFLAVTYGYTPDLWSVKPPLMIWLIALSFKLFGYNELALRLPSALCGFFIIVIIYQFCNTVFRNKSVSFWSVFVLITSQGFIDNHVVRTGDYDALLILFQVLSITYFIQYHFYSRWGTPSVSHRNLYISALFLSGAIFTKGIAGLLFCPAILLWLISDKTLHSYLKARSTYTAFLIAFLPISIYTLLRERQKAGYIQALWDMELFKRYAYGDGDVYISNMDWWDKLNYYIGTLYHSDFMPWFIFIPFCIGFIFINQEVSQRSILRFLGLNCLIFLSIITLSTSKKAWYDAPIYPLLAILIGFTLHQFHTYFEKKLVKKGHILAFNGALLLCLSFPYMHIIQKNLSNGLKSLQSEQLAYSPSMKEAVKKYDFCILQTGYNASIDFTAHVLNEESSHKINCISVRDSTFFPSKIKTQNYYLICEAEAWDSLNQYFVYKSIDSLKTCKTVFIEERR